MGEDKIFLVLILSLMLFLAGGVSLDSWNEHQIRVMYQNAYAKNQDCRIAAQKSGFTNSVEKICGVVPKFGDYQND